MTVIHSSGLSRQLTPPWILCWTQRLWTTSKQYTCATVVTKLQPDKNIRPVMNNLFVFHRRSLNGSKNVKCKSKFNAKHRERLRDHPSQRLMIKCLMIKLMIKWTDVCNVEHTHWQDCQDKPSAIFLMSWRIFKWWARSVAKIMSRIRLKTSSKSWKHNENNK